MSTHSFPADFEKQLREVLQQDWESFCVVQQQPSPTSIRYNPRKDIIQPDLDRILWTNHGYYLKERSSFTLDPLFHAGTYYVQEASSMLLEQVFKQCVPADQPLKVLDLCAAPGGKSTHLLSLISDKSLLVANEAIRARANILAENIQKWGYNNVIVTQNDPEDFLELHGFFDMIVVDAPCSGEGLFRKDPDAMREWSTQHVSHCSSRQKRILSDILPSLKEGGLLIYSTCTYNQQENENNLTWLKENADVEFLTIKTDPTWGFEQTEHNGSVGYRAYPHRVKGEGFFISAIRKHGSAEQIRAKKNARSNWTSVSKKIEENIYPWVKQPQQKKFILRNDLIQFFPTEVEHDLTILSQKLRIVTAGTLAATLKHDKLIPEHAMALSVDLDQSHFNQAPLNLQEAIHYLRKDPVSLNLDTKGFALITYNNIPLGWVNILNNRFNNLYPSAWRIRMDIPKD